ncbi:GGDEF domain-containing protein [Pseudonocardia sp. ICBG1293]|uniref:GGDEF domain-containing protein n=1 Tax=Pseudonocardia sp. ICBG1293 TaxID=2844382 RepID=UPI001CCD89E4|nr:GGDEF domain-containing protein [Pseudonocardia sp. ICBG1293]
MISGPVAPRATGRRRPAPDARSLRGLPLRPLLLVLVVEAAAVTAVGTGIVATTAPTRTEVLLCGLLVLVAAAHTELSVGAERLRRRIAETRYINMTSVWTFAAALLLPPGLATVVVAVVYLHLYLRVARPSGTPPHRQVYSAATVLLAVHTVAGLLALVDGRTGALATPQNAALVLGALVAYTAVNTLLVVSVLRLTAPGSRFLAILLGGDIGLELATLSIGGLVAVVLANTSPWFALLAVLPLLVVEQTTLVRQLEAQVDTDAKTGLLNPAAWRWRSRQMLERDARTDRAAAVLILDLDHFKAVNDRHGHLAGDDVLQAVADVLTAEVRDHDLAGRFGGEEFVVTLGGMRADDDPAARAREVAERIRRGVRALEVDTTTAGRVAGLSVSVGVATTPDHGSDLDGLLAAADAALYEAKRAGRDRVAVRRPAPPPVGDPATPPFGLSYGT